MRLVLYTPAKYCITVVAEELREAVAIDVGNTRLKFAHFQGGTMVDLEVYTHAEWAERGIPAFVEGRPIVVSSVVEDFELPAELVRSSPLYLRLDAATPVPFHTEYQRAQLGRDRVAALAGARYRSSGRAVLVVDAGTCMTCDVLDAEGVHRGGNIAPGVRMRLEAMHRFTSALPQVELSGEVPLLGQTTEEAMQAGALRGMAFEIEGYCRVLEREFPNFALILTGGDARLLQAHIARRSEIRPHLVLEGLYEILQYNALL